MPAATNEWLVSERASERTNGNNKKKIITIGGGGGAQIGQLKWSAAVVGRSSNSSGNSAPQLAARVRQSAAAARQWPFARPFAQAVAVGYSLLLLCLSAPAPAPAPASSSSLAEPRAAADFLNVRSSPVLCGACEHKSRRRLIYAFTGVRPRRQQGRRTLSGGSLDIFVC